MRLIYPSISKEFDTESSKINTLIIENQYLFVNLLQDIQGQIDGYEGNAVLSLDYKPINISNSLELITDCLSLDMNSKAIINKICSRIEKIAVNDLFEETTQIISRVQEFLFKASNELSCDITYDKLDISSIIKASGVHINSHYDSLGEKLIDYMELVREFDREKLFVFVNLRSYMSDSETEKFFETVLKHCYNILVVESSERPILINEERFIIDNNLCEIY